MSLVNGSGITHDNRDNEQLMMHARAERKPMPYRHPARGVATRPARLENETEQAKRS